jgi:hypothetical protein
VLRGVILRAGPDGVFISAPACTDEVENAA